MGSQLLLVGVGAGPGGVTPVRELVDNFNTTAGPLENRPLQSGQSWTAVSGQINDEGGFADCKVAQPPNSIYVANLGAPFGNGSVRMKFSATDGSFAGIVFRSNASTDFWLAGVYQGDFKLYLYKSVGGVLTVLDTANPGADPGVYYDMIVTNSAAGVTATLNGVSVSSNDAFAIANTRWGLWGNELGCAWQNFHVEG